MPSMSRQGGRRPQRLKAGRRDQSLDHVDDDIIGLLVFIFIFFPQGGLLNGAVLQVLLCCDNSSTQLYPRSQADQIPIHPFFLPVPSAFVYWTATHLLHYPGFFPSKSSVELGLPSHGGEIVSWWPGISERASAQA